MVVSLGELAVRFGCELRGDPDIRVEGVGTLAHADEHSIAFLAEARNRRELAGTRAAAVVLDRASLDACPTAALICDNPRATFARITLLFHPPQTAPAGVHPTASVSAGARLDPSVHVGALAVIGDGAVIAAGAYVGPHCVVEDEVTVGEA